MFLRVVLAMALALPACLAAQDQPPAPKKDTYKLDYTIIEMENGKKTEARNYTMLVSADLARRELSPTATGRIRVGTRVPMVTGTSPDGRTQSQYFDVGMNIDGNLTPVGENLVNISTMIEVSSVVAGSEAGRLGPVTRQLRGEDRTTLTLGKTATIFTMDEPNSKRSFQIQLTATRLVNP